MRQRYQKEELVLGTAGSCLPQLPVQSGSLPKDVFAVQVLFALPQQRPIIISFHVLGTALKHAHAHEQAGRFARRMATRKAPCHNVSATYRRFAV